MEIPEVPSYLALKAIHIIFMVSYFAGIFYLIRLFVYYIDANQRDPQAKEILQQEYKYMMSRLWDIIVVPAGIIMLITGILMMMRKVGDINFYILKQPWFHVKLAFLLLLLAYHIWSWRCIKQIKKGTFSLTSVKLRMCNEIATFILFAVVFIVIYKANFIRMWLGLLISFVVLVAVIMLVVKWVNKNKK